MSEELFDGVPEAPKMERSKAMFSIDEIIAIIAALVVERSLSGQYLTAHEVFEAYPIFRERNMKKANAIGDALGYRGLRLWRGKLGVEPCFENAALACNRMASEAREALARKLDLESVEVLKDKITALPRAIK